LRSTEKVRLLGFALEELDGLQKALLVLFIAEDGSLN
jgi:hypothetical protein